MKNRILYIQYTNPAGYPPLEHSSKILADLGWQILFIGTGAYGNANDLCFPSHPQIKIKKIPFSSIKWFQKAHYIIYCLLVFAYLILWRPKWVYASDPLISPLALLLSYISVNIIYHEHDSPDPGTKDISNFMKFVLWTRKKMARRVPICILPNSERARHFSETTGRKKNVFTVWNCPLRGEADHFNFSVQKGNDFWLLYHGSIVPDRLPLTVVTAMSLLPSYIKLRVIGYETVGHKNYVKQIKEQAKKEGIVSRIEYLGSMPRKELLRQSRMSDLGIMFLPPASKDINTRSMFGASCKFFDYLACQLPVLVSASSAWKKMCVDLGYGLACDSEDPKSIAAAIDWFANHSEERKRMGETGRGQILDEWNYEKQFESILKKILEK